MGCKNPNELLAAMNGHFSQHDAFMSLSRPKVEQARAHDAAAQLLKLRLLSDGWRLRCSRDGQYELHGNVGPMILQDEAPK